MTSAVNRLPLSSGNRWSLFFGIALLTAACSPKLQPVAEQPRQPAVVKPPPPKVIKPVVAGSSNHINHRFTVALRAGPPGARHRLYPGQSARSRYRNGLLSRI